MKIVAILLLLAQGAFSRQSESATYASFLGSGEWDFGAVGVYGVYPWSQPDSRDIWCWCPSPDRVRRVTLRIRGVGDATIQTWGIEGIGPLDTQLLSFTDDGGQRYITWHVNGAVRFTLMPGDGRAVVEEVFVDPVSPGLIRLEPPTNVRIVP